MPALIPVTVAGWLTVISYVITIASAVESSRRARSVKRRMIRDYNASLEDRLVMAATANGARSRCYGRVRNVDGVVFKGTWGATSEMYTLVVALAGHEIDGIEQIYFNDVPVELQADGVPLADGRQGYWVVTPPILRSPVLTKSATMVVVGGAGSVTLPFTPISGSVTAGVPIGSGGGDNETEGATPTVVGNVASVSGVLTDGNWTVTYQHIGFFPQARVWKYLGAPGQDMSPLLVARFPTIISSTDRFEGMAALVVELQFNQDAWPTGLPSISAVIRGAKVYDPRTTLTAWTENPALIARDWALYANGGGCELAHITESSFTAAANACDVLTEFDTTAEPVNLPLYQCGIVCRLDGDADDSFDEMVESMAGKWGWGGGQLTVVAGVYRAPVVDITDEWLSDAEDIVVVKDAPRTDVVNVYRPTIANAESYISGAVIAESSPTTYTVTPLPEVRSAAFIAADGQELPREITFGGVTRLVHAQHICGVMMRDARDGLILRLPCNLRAWQLELFDVVTVTLPFFGFETKLFEVLGWKYSVDNGVVLTLKETAASIYDPDSGLWVLNAAQNSTLPLPWNVGGIGGLAATSGTVSLSDGTPQTRTRLTWNASQEESVRQAGKIEIQYIPQLTSPLPDDWSSQMEEGTATSAVIPGLLAGQPYLFRVRAINTLGVRSLWSLQHTHVVTIPPEVAIAQAASANATAALAALADIASDNILTAGEKPAIILDNSVILAEQAGIDAKAIAQAITTEKTAYDTAVTALITYLATLTTPVLWSDLSGNTTIVGATFRSKFADVYSTRQTLLNLIAVKIAAGAVDTGELAPDAATEILSSEVDSLTWTTPTSDYLGRGTLVQSLASVTHNNTLSTPVILEVTASTNATLTTQTLGFTQDIFFKFDVWSAPGTRLGGAYGVQHYLPDGATTDVSASIVWQFTLPAGTNGIVDFFATGLFAPSGYAATAENINLRVAVVKR